MSSTVSDDPTLRADEVGEPTPRRVNGRFVFGAVVVLVAVVLTFTVVDYRLFQLTTVTAWALAMLGLNLLTGFNGQISLGHGAFMGIGGYTVAIAVREFGMSYPLAFVLAFVICFVLGGLIGIPALRLPGISLALMTLAMALAFPQVLRKFDGLTGGSQGIVTPPARQFNAPDWTGLTTDQFRYLVVVAIGAFMFWVAWNITRGRWGLAMMSVRDNPLSAVSMGVNQSSTKIMTFAISAAYAGLGGALMAMVTGFMSPEDVTIFVSINILAGSVIGGLNTVAGAIIGGFFIVFMPNYATEINDQAPGVIYGLIIVIVMLVAPGGILGLIRRLRSTIAGRVGRGPSASPADDAAPQPAAATSTSPPVMTQQGEAT